MRAAAKTAKRNNAAARGFSLIELAIAMFIFALIISSILGPAADLYQKRKNNETRQYLDRASRAIINYALRNRTVYREITYDGTPAVIPPGRPYLPCPDTDGNGIENRNEIPASLTPIAITDTANNDGACVSPKGTIPWRTLQLLPATDPWKNYLTYHVDASYSNALFGFDETTRADRHDITRITTAMTIYQRKPEETWPFVVCRRPGTATVCPSANDDNIIAGVLTSVNIDAPPYDYDRNNFPDGIVKGVAFLLISHGANGRYARSQTQDGCRGGGPVNISDFTTVFGQHEYRNGYGACPDFPTGESQQFYFSYPLTDHPITGEFDDILRWTMGEELMGALTDAGRTRENEAEVKSPLPIGKLLFLPR